MRICVVNAAIKDRERLGLGKPETFDFLGFTHFCTKSRMHGDFVIGRKTIKKRMRATLRAIKVELRNRMHDAIKTTGTWVERVLHRHLGATMWLLWKWVVIGWLNVSLC